MGLVIGTQRIKLFTEAELVSVLKSQINRLRSEIARIGTGGGNHAQHAQQVQQNINDIKREQSIRAQPVIQEQEQITTTESTPTPQPMVELTVQEKGRKVQNMTLPANQIIRIRGAR